MTFLHEKKQSKGTLIRETINHESACVIAILQLNTIKGVGRLRPRENQVCYHFSSKLTYCVRTMSNDEVNTSKSRAYGGSYLKQLIFLPPATLET